MAFLTVRDLVVDVPTAAGRARAVDGVGFDVAAGRVVAIVGESGSGKSLTALACTGLLPAGVCSTAGTVIVDGFGDVQTMGEKQRRRLRGGAIGMVFQQPTTSLNPVMRVGAQVVEPMAARGARAVAQAVALFERVGIPEPERRMRCYPHELSGGMQQRVCMAMALAGQPQCLIADEPTTALDVTVQAQVLELLRGLVRESNLAVLLITHDLGVVAEIADEVVVMYAGVVVEKASAEVLFDQPRHPYTQALLAARPRLTGERTRLVPIAGVVPPPHARPSGCVFRDRCTLATEACCQRPQLRSYGAGATACWVTPC